MRRRQSIAVLVIAFAATTTQTATAGEQTLRDQYRSLYRKAEHRLGNGAAGRNIIKDGVRGRAGDRPARHREVAVSIRTMRTMLAPPRPAATTTATTSASVPVSSVSGGGSSSGGGPGNGTAQCESGGNPQAVSPGGKYRGKWQFDQQTWDAYAPSGYGGSDPAAAPEGVQDQAAANVPYDAWPNC